MSRTISRVVIRSAFLVLSVLAAPASVVAQELKPVAVFPIQSDVQSFDGARMSKFTALLDGVMAANGHPTVPQAELKARLDEEQRSSYDTCYDESCQIELGKAMAAQKALTSSWARFGRTCMFTAKLYDLRRAVTERSANADAACTEEGLKNAIKEVGAALRHDNARIAAAPAGAPGAVEPRAGAEPAVTPLATLPPNAVEAESEGGSVLVPVLIIVGAVALSVVVAAVVVSAASDASDFDTFDGALVRF